MKYIITQDNIVLIFMITQENIIMKYIMTQEDIAMKYIIRQENIIMKYIIRKEKSFCNISSQMNILLCNISSHSKTQLWNIPGVPQKSLQLFRIFARKFMPKFGGIRYSRVYIGKFWFDFPKVKFKMYPPPQKKSQILSCRFLANCLLRPGGWGALFLGHPVPSHRKIIL